MADLADLLVAAVLATAPVQSRALEDLRRQDARVAQIALRLAVANVSLCPARRPQFGMVLHSALQYAPSLRPAARNVLAAVDGPSIEAVAAGGPAAAAGLQVGDVLEAVSGTTLAREGRDDIMAATYATVEQAWMVLDRAAAQGAVEVSVLRGREHVDVKIEPVAGCAYDVQLDPSTRMGAASDGRHVSVTTALAAYVDRDEDLALVIGHELAHDALGHHHRRRREDALTGTLFGAWRRDEAAADYLGIYMAARGGFDESRAGAFWRRFAADHGDAWLRLNHPSKAARAAAAERAWAEIERRQLAAEPLTPSAAPP